MQRHRSGALAEGESRPQHLQNKLRRLVDGKARVEERGLLQTEEAGAGIHQNGVEAVTGSQAQSPVQLLLLARSLPLESLAGKGHSAAQVGQVLRVDRLDSRLAHQRFHLAVLRGLSRSVAAHAQRSTEAAREIDGLQAGAAGRRGGHGLGGPGQAGVPPGKPVPREPAGPIGDPLHAVGTEQQMEPVGGVQEKAQ